MVRDKLLALLLVISLCGNVYLIFFDHSGDGSFFQNVSSNPNLPFFRTANNSNQTDFFLGGQGENVPFLSNPDHAVVSDNITPEGKDGDINPDEQTGNNPDEQTGNATGEGNESEDLPLQEVNLTPTEVAGETAQPNSLILYTSPNYGFSLTYPRNWSVNDAVAGRTVLTLIAPVESACDSESNQCYKYIANFTVEIDQNPPAVSLEEYFNNAVVRLQNDYAITTTSKSASTLISDARAYQIEYYTRDKRGNPDRSYMQYYTIIDGKGYIVSYFGPYATWDNVYHHNKADAQRTIDSFIVNRTYKPA